ncbi:hypothetical protein TorRG33x02_192590 [Trema orientale]|uniref:Uncharacterized protein n=1 Tax=Trema orientale TaxID=63057 RepID=A0A2P5EHI4_TREOI|nr:hypothetical protein TorRG33x02_192590 [Trema orientale]
MVSKKDLRSLQTELLETMSHNTAIRKKMEELEKLRDGSLSAESEELKALVFESNQTLMTLYDIKTEEGFKSYKITIQRMANGAQALSKRLDEFEEKFRKYNVPKLGDSDSLLGYTKNLREFMKIWKEEGGEGREKEEKSLIEWLQLLIGRQSDQEERKETFEEMKDVAIELGIQISHHLVEYFALAAERDDTPRKLDDVGVMIRFLSVEENSMIIKRFFSVVEFAKSSVLLETEKCSMDSAGKVSYDETEQEVLHLILREVLRLEVAFCCPDLPMMLTDDVYLSMASHLMKVFENKLEKVNLKINELKMESLSIRDPDKDPKTWNIPKEKLDMGMQEIWNRLDFQSC